jgi:hypothetical protein
MEADIMTRENAPDSQQRPTSAPLSKALSRGEFRPSLLTPPSEMAAATMELRAVHTAGHPQHTHSSAAAATTMVRAIEQPSERHTHHFDHEHPATIEVRALDPAGEQETIEVSMVGLSHFSTPNGAPQAAHATLEIQIDVADPTSPATSVNYSASQTADYRYEMGRTTSAETPPSSPAPGRWHQVAAKEAPSTQRPLLIALVVACIFAVAVFAWR